MAKKKKKKKSAQQELENLQANLEASRERLSSLEDLQTELQGMATESKQTSKDASIEISTIALEQAINTGDSTAAVNAARELADLQGITGAAKAAATIQARDEAKATELQNRELSKPTEDPGAGNIWSFNVRENRWKRVAVSSGVSGVSGAGNVGAGNVGSGNVNTSGVTDKATLDLIKSLQDQVAALSASNQQAAIDKAAADAAAKQERTQNAIAVLTKRFTDYNLQSLVPKIRELAIAGASEDTIALQLQETEEYKKRFIGNEERIKKGLKVLDPGTYLGLEDRYRQIIRAYGLKQFDNDDYVQQFISNDVSPEELSSRVVNAVQRVQNADPAVSAMLRQYYNIGVTDMVAYVLDPANQLPKIERQIGAAEIGVAAGRQGLTAGVNVAEQLAAQGITQAEAQRGYATIADVLPGATKLSQIYTGVLDQYGQAEAEQEVFNSLASAQRKRRALAEREISTFTGASGLGRTALDQGTRGNF